VSKDNGVNLGTVRVDIKTTNFVQIRNSPQVIAACQAKAEAIAAAANSEQSSGEGFMVMPPETNYSRSGRARVAVITASAEAMNGEALDRRLTRALDAGRG